MTRWGRFLNAAASAPFLALEWLDRRPMYVVVGVTSGLLLLILWAVPWSWLTAAVAAYAVYWGTRLLFERVLLPLRARHRG